MKRVVSGVPVLLLLLLGCSEDPLTPGAVDADQGPLFSETVFTGAFSVGGFDAADPLRGGDWTIAGGAAFDDARASLSANFPSAAITPVSEFTDPGLSGLDIVILSSARTNYELIEPLDASMQAALRAFVETGGCAILFSENDWYGSAPGESLIDPFGMDLYGTFWGWQNAVVNDPAASPVTDGPFGTVSSFLQAVPGILTNLGPYAISAAINDWGIALAVIEPGMIIAGSGPVVVFSDVNSFGDIGFTGAFAQNETLWLNTINYCLTPATPDEKVESIKSDVAEVADAGRLNKGESGSLTAKLSLAQKRISEGKDNAAINILGAFINQVEALVNSGRLTPEEGQTLIGAAQAVIDQLNG